MTDPTAAADDRLRWRVVWLFGLASLLAIGLGAAVMAQAGVPLSIWIRNPVAWLAAAGVAIFLGQRGWIAGSMAPAALIVLAISLLGPDMEGVRRWLDLGPVQLNAAALVLPAAIAAFPRANPFIAIVSFALIAGILAIQPDISQLAGYSIAALVLFGARFGLAGAIGALVIGGGAIALCLTRPDPLDAVPHVEGIFLLAWAQSPALALTMAAALASAALSPLLLWRTPGFRWPALALGLYFATTALACALGAYPAPLAGYGLSFVIGWWLAIPTLAPGPEQDP